MSMIMFWLFCVLLGIRATFPDAFTREHFLWVSGFPLLHGRDHGLNPTTMNCNPPSPSTPRSRVHSSRCEFGLDARWAISMGGHLAPSAHDSDRATDGNVGGATEGECAVDYLMSCLGDKGQIYRCTICYVCTEYKSCCSFRTRVGLLCSLFTCLSWKLPSVLKSDFYVHSSVPFPRRLEIVRHNSNQGWFALLRTRYTLLLCPVVVPAQSVRLVCSGSESQSVSYVGCRPSATHTS